MKVKAMNTYFYCPPKALINDFFVFKSVCVAQVQLSKPGEHGRCHL